MRPLFNRFNIIQALKLKEYQFRLIPVLYKNQLRNLLISLEKIIAFKESQEKFGTPMTERVELEEVESFQKAVMEKETGAILVMNSMQLG